MSDLSQTLSPPRGKPCLVTGGAGFIGSALVRALLARGVPVRVLDNFSSGRRENLAALAGVIDLVEGDIRDSAALEHALAGTDAVFHLAALVSVPRSLEAPLEDHEINCAATLALLQQARAAGVRRVMYSSSAAIYGDNPRLPLTESEAAAPLSPYGASKYAGEMYARLYRAAFGLETVCLRYFNVYGPRQDPRSPYSGVLSRFIAAFDAGLPPTVFGDGGQSRDFVFVEDVALANCLAMTAPARVVAGNVYNIATGKATSLLEVMQSLQAITGSRLVPVMKSARAGDIRHSQADIARARAELRYEPAWSLQPGLERTLAWMRAEGIDT